MELIKSHWVAEGDKVRLSVPFAKVDEERRLVSGFATLDNVDSQADVVLAEASAGAFARFRGNIREMHQPIAAGRLVDFKEDSFYDPQDKRFYRGVYVTVYVSRGAQDTWEKVLDGTLSGFSIGGSINEAETEFNKEAGKPVRFIKDYDLIELSLVDNPANQLANVFSITKSEGVTMMKGMVTDTTFINVFWCEKDEIAKNSSNESEDCLACGTSMNLIGWFEKGEDIDNSVQDAVSKYLRQREDSVAVEKQADSANGEGGVEMADEQVRNEVEETPEVPAAQDAETGEVAPVEEVESEEVSEETEEAAEVAEVEVNEPDFEKMFDNLRDSVNESLQDSKATVEKAVEAVEAKVTEVTKAFDEKASELEKNLNELSERLDGIRTEREDVAKRLDALEKATALKKSGDVETAPEKKLQKGLWSGTFFDGE